MQAKLTLRLDEKLIRRAKSVAAQSGKSVSQMVADYFASLDHPPISEEVDLTPVVRSLKGALRGGSADVEDYHRYLEDKYL